MANMNESIDQLTASLQELTKSYCLVQESETVAGNLPVDQLEVSKAVESFVTETNDYVEKTRNVSAGTY